MRKYYLGIDVSKGYSDFVILDGKGKQVEANFQLDDNFEGHNKLWEIVSKLTGKDPDSMICAGVESTGGYENNWYNVLRKYRTKLPVIIARLNPIGVHHSIKADMKRNVTDKVSASSIAEYMIACGDKIEYDKEDYYSELRKQMVFVNMLTKQKVQLENQMESLLYSANPEILSYCKSGKPGWVMKLLLKYPTADKLSRAHVDSLSSIPYISRSRAEELIKAAKKSVASSKGTIIENLIIDTMTQIIGIIQMTEKQLTSIQKECKLEELEILGSFKGIGIESAVGLLLEIGAIERFPTVKKLTSFFGLHPVYKQSGDGICGMHMSKQGRKQPRAILYMVAFSAIQHNPTIKKLFSKCLANGMKGNAAIGVCMHKIIRIIYGMLKNKTMFNSLIDEINQASRKDNVNGVSKDKSRRYQKMSALAPVSRRQVKKRKARLVPQDDNTIMNGVTS
jgi:transposase